MAIAIHLRSLLVGHRSVRAEEGNAVERGHLLPLFIPSPSRGVAHHGGQPPRGRPRHHCRQTVLPRGLGRMDASSWTLALEELGLGS